MASRKTHADFIADIDRHNELSCSVIQLRSDQLYQGLETPLVFVCSEHGEFTTTPRNITVKHTGCPACSRIRTSQKNTTSIDGFLTRLVERNQHHEPIEYVAGYTGTTKSCTFRCTTCQHEWDTLPKSILKGHGCPECASAHNSMRMTMTHSQFLTRLLERNLETNDNIEVCDDSTYLGNGVKIKFVCGENHVWEARPGDILSKHSGCPHCAGTVSRSATAALAEIQEKHPLLTIISNHYDKLGRREQIEAQCEYGHTWNTHYERLINGHYCPHCFQNAKYTTQTFAGKLAGVTKTLRITGEYINSTTPIDTECLDCGNVWQPRPYTILQGGGCPACSRNNKFSKKALAWLAYTEAVDGVQINHAKKQGEYRIPGTKYRADGYCPSTNTIYEFYGDYWHGNPAVFEPHDHNQHLDKTFGELYQKTIERETEIRSLGYNLETMWEQDFDTFVETNFAAEVVGLLKLPSARIIRQSPHIVAAENDRVTVVVVNTRIAPEDGDRTQLLKLKQQYTKQGKYTVLLFIDELRENADLVSKKIDHYCGLTTSPRLHARQLIIKETTRDEKRDLLNRNHVQGNDYAQINIGAYHGETLVAVMTFSKPRVALGQKGPKDKVGMWELSRFCTDVEYRIPGIGSRLLKYFQKRWEWKQIYSYADKRWSVGNMYDQLGFALVKDNPPDYYYIVNGSRKHRWTFRKDVLKNTLEHYDPNKTEHENMSAHGYWWVWDCGTLKFQLNNIA